MESQWGSGFSFPVFLSKCLLPHISGSDHMAYCLFKKYLLKMLRIVTDFEHQKERVSKDPIHSYGLLAVGSCWEKASHLEWVHGHWYLVGGPTLMYTWVEPTELTAYETKEENMKVGGEFVGGSQREKGSWEETWDVYGYDQVYCINV